MNPINNFPTNDIDDKDNKIDSNFIENFDEYIENINKPSNFIMDFQNNIYQNKKQTNNNFFNKNNIKKLNKKLNYKNYQKINLNDFNLQIPVEIEPNNNVFHNDNNEMNNKLNNFLKIKNKPCLFLDFSDDSYKLELNFIELQSKLNEKESILQKYEKDFIEKDKIILELQKKLKEKENEILFYNSKNESFSKDLNNFQMEKEKYLNIIKDYQKNNNNNSKKNIDYIKNKFKNEIYNENFIIKTLQKDILDYQYLIEQKIKPKKIIAEKVFNQIKNIINGINNEYEIILNDSFAYNLILPWDNIEINLIHNNINNFQNKYQNIQMNFYFFQLLQNTFQNLNFVKKIEFKNPQNPHLMKILTNEIFDNIIIEISIQEDKNYILNCIELIKNYLKEYKILKPLILTLNTILKKANLHSENIGGLSLYGLILMTVSYIQNKNEEYNEKEENLIGKILYGFLEYYAINFDFQKYFIFTNLPKNMEYLNENNNDSYNDIIKNINVNNNVLTIIDPINKKNNVTKKCQFLNLKMAFTIAFMVTKEDCECGCHYGKCLNEHDLFSIEHCILKRMFNSVKRYNEIK